MKFFEFLGGTRLKTREGALYKYYIRVKLLNPSLSIIVISHNVLFRKTERKHMKTVGNITANMWKFCSRHLWYKHPNYDSLFTQSLYRLELLARRFKFFSKWWSLLFVSSRMVARNNKGCSRKRKDLHDNFEYSIPMLFTFWKRPQFLLILLFHFFLLLHRESYAFHPPRNTYNKALGFLRPRPNVEHETEEPNPNLGRPKLS